MIVISLAKLILEGLSHVWTVRENRPWLLKVLSFELSLGNLEIQGTTMELHRYQSIAMYECFHFFVLPICTSRGPFNGNVCTTLSCDLAQNLKGLPKPIEYDAMFTYFVSCGWIDLIDELP